jgi:hypothetical protein
MQLELFVGKQKVACAADPQESTTNPTKHAWGAAPCLGSHLFAGRGSSSFFGSPRRTHGLLCLHEPIRGSMRVSGTIHSSSRTACVRKGLGGERHSIMIVYVLMTILYGTEKSPRKGFVIPCKCTGLFLRCPERPFFRAESPARLRAGFSATLPDNCFR